MAILEILDSKFNANRTGLRSWRELRSIGRAMWSQAEEDKLRRECLTVSDDGNPFMLPLTSNATLWAVAFERYGVPLSDLFTYGLKPHPKSTRGPRAKYITPLCCQLLVVIMVHPIFQAKIDLVRYVLQCVICLRMGVHQPPVGPATDISDDANPTLDRIADILYNEDESMGQIEAYHGALWLYIQESGIYTHPEIVNLVEALRVAFKDVKAFQGASIPGDNTPHCRTLFFLQLWDLQFLLQVLNDMASPRGYLPAEEYHKQWLKVARRVRPYIESKIEDLVESWFLLDERNDRVRQKLFAMRSGRPIYDIGEEDFRPLYARSELITVGMRSILCGDFLKPLCPSEQVDIADNRIQEDVMSTMVQKNMTSNGMQNDGLGATGNEVRDDTPDVTDDETEEAVPDNETQDTEEDVVVQNTYRDVNMDNTVDDSEMQATHGNTAMQSIEINTDMRIIDDDAYIPARNAKVVDDSDEYEPSEMSGDEDDDDYGTGRAPQTRRRRRPSSTSIASFHSISSSKADEWEPTDDDLPIPKNEYIARRGVPEQHRHKPVYRRRQGRE
ncbi:hypothetical protein VMCG_03896 [Cytospora schulzeri]|uniref:Uncharacterized protein n=1 Tax=Cytospora schulzeri TaxID=448051 RepID=A0A423WVE6_9PEZI|nr:hypothetical protein VMCG_03896 [Valsa malicola]